MYFTGPMNGPDPIANLLSRVALREPLAFRQLYDQTSAKLFGICLRILNNRADAEEALQEVFVKIWNKADMFQTGRASGIAWMAMITRNQAIDRLRARKPGSVDILEQSDLADDKPSPETNTIASDEYRRLNNCLDELKPQHAEAVRKTYLGGWSYQETADALNIPLNTAKTWVRRSLGALQDCMKR